MDPTTQLLWNLVLTIAGAFGMYILNHINKSITELTKADRELSKEISSMRTEFVPKSEFMAYGDRIEKRLESYMALQLESNKTLFAKLDLISDKLSGKMDRAECSVLHKD